MNICICIVVEDAKLTISFSKVAIFLLLVVRTWLIRFFILLKSCRGHPGLVSITWYQMQPILLFLLCNSRLINKTPPCNHGSPIWKKTNYYNIGLEWLFIRIYIYDILTYLHYTSANDIYTILVVQKLKSHVHFPYHASR